MITSRIAAKEVVATGRHSRHVTNLRSLQLAHTPDSGHYALFKAL
jgi:hypothetical protein